MKLIELKFTQEICNGKEENIISIYLIDNLVMKYIVNNDMFKNNDCRVMEGDIPMHLKPVMAMLMKKGGKEND